MSTEDSEDERFLDAVAQLGPALLAGCDGLERAWRRLDPPLLPALRGALGPLRDRLEEALERFEALEVAEPLVELAAQIRRAARHTETSLQLFTESAGPEEGIGRVLRAMSEHCRALEALHPLRRALPPINRFLLEPEFADRVTKLDPEPPAREPSGILHARNGVDERGGFSLYVPESVAPGEPRPLVVALHGGSGHGRDFLWTWFREARSRRCLLLAPTAIGPTWSFNGPDVDASNLRAMVERIRDGWDVDPERILLTGLSDGATYSLCCGLQEDAPYTAIAPLSGVLHPANFANGNLGRAAGRRIYLVHGSRDWMFPPQVARMAAEELREAGADLVFRELEDLSHTYAREENARILEWLEPA